MDGLRRILASALQPLEPLYLADEGGGRHIHIWHQAQVRGHLELEKFQLARHQVAPEAILPGFFDLRQQALEREGIGGQSGDLGAQVGDHLLAIGGLLLAQVGLQQAQARVEDGHQHRHGSIYYFLGILAEVIFPEIQDQEALLFVIRQPFQVVAGRLAARAAPDHLVQLDRRLHRFHEHQVDRFGHINAGVEHIHRDGDARLGLLFEGIHQGAAIL